MGGLPQASLQLKDFLIRQAPKSIRICRMLTKSRLQLRASTLTSKS
jgi:hypothetical protein